MYYSKPDDSGDDYLVDHSIMSYLIDPEGNFAAYFGQNMSATDMADGIARHSRGWQPTSPPEALPSPSPASPTPK